MFLYVSDVSGILKESEDLKHVENPELIVRDDKNYKKTLKDLLVNNVKEIYNNPWHETTEASTSSNTGK